MWYNTVYAVYLERGGRMKRTAIAGAIAAILIGAPAQGPAQALEQASADASASAVTSLPAAGLGTFSTGRGTHSASLQDLRKAAAEASAKGCGKEARVVALVDDSLSAGLLAQYGWRVVTRIGTVATLAGCAASAPYLCALPGIRYIKMPSRAYPTLDSVRKIVHVNEVHKTVPGWTGPRLTGKGVLFGIIDTDFDTRHKAFLDSNGYTRFTALWDQADTTPGFPNSYGYGVMKNHAGILADSMFGLGSDGHGTLMASYAAGADWASPYYGVAPDVTIAGVKMGNTDQAIIDGLDWIFSIADSLGLPCVVNMSLGSPEGPHDGSSLVDRAIDSVSGAGRIVVGAIGNDGSKREHVQITVAAGQSQGTWVTTVPYTSPWYAAEIEMWGDSGKSFTASFYVIDSSTRAYGLPSPRKNLNSATSTPDAAPLGVTWNGNTLAFQVTAVESASPLNGKPHIQAVMFSPNGNLFFGAYVAVPGGGTVHCWNAVQRPFKGLGIANYLDGDSVTSVNELGGTAKRIITVGAYNSKLVYTFYDGSSGGYPPDDSGFHTLCGYSGRGPTVDGRIKPDITAPGSNPAGAMPRFVTNYANVVYWPGWPDSPAVEGRYMVTGGTSVSSPIVAGVVALMLEYDPALTMEAARKIIQETALNDSATGAIGTKYNNLWGAGKVTALGAVDRLINGTSVRPPGPPVDVLPYYVPGRLVLLSGHRLKFTGNAKAVSIELFSLQGRRAMRTVDKSTVSLAHLPQGVYFARAIEKGRVVSSRKISIIK
jgi:minor extracellular serine protease Vpr